jgi:hypothetical protein
MREEASRTSEDGWVGFPGGELEGRRPKALCQACRDALQRSATSSGGHGHGAAARGGQGIGAGGAQAIAAGRARTICFQCYRAELDRERALRDAGRIDTASEARFQAQLPFEPIDKPRLQMLKVERARARHAEVLGHGRFIDRRREAQIAARHALQTIAAGLKARTLAGASAEDRARAMAIAIHAAELQLPESWIPFVVSK